MPPKWDHRPTKKERKNTSEFQQISREPTGIDENVNQISPFDGHSAIATNFIATFVKIFTR